MSYLESWKKEQCLFSTKLCYYYSLDITNVVFLELKIFLWVPATAVGTATVNPNGIKTLLANGLSTFFIKDKLVFNNGLRTLPRSSPDCDSFYIDMILK